MTRFVLCPGSALQIARDGLSPAAGHRLLAPTLLRSQVLSLVYRAVRCGEIEAAEGRRRLDQVRKLRIRLLGDRVLQDLAWRIAESRGLADTLAAEYIALTQLQADALVTLDGELALAAEGLVRLAPAAELFAQPPD